jgi:hypothetical protein
MNPLFFLVVIVATPLEVVKLAVTMLPKGYLVDGMTVDLVVEMS